MNEAIATVGSGAVKIASPFGRLNLIITLFALSILIVSSAIQCFRQDSIFPLFDGALFRIVGADHKLSQDLDALPSNLADGAPGLLSKGWFSWVWNIILLVLNVLLTLWFIYIIIYALYKLFYGLNNTNPLMNVAYAIIIFMILEIIVGLLLYSTSLAGKTVVDDKQEIMGDAISSSYPLEGIVKLAVRLWNGNIFDKAYAAINSPTGVLITGIPSGNATGV